MKRIVILASGNGSNFEAIINAIKKNSWPIECVAMITDNPSARVIKRAQRLKVPCIIFDYRSFKGKNAYNQALLKKLEELNPDLIALAGYMRILPPFIVERFRWKIVNIHPAILPAFPGLNAIERAYKAGCKVMGITIHYVDEGVDSGPIIEQACIKVREGETLGSVERRIHRLEHKTYPRVIKKLLLGD